MRSVRVYVGELLCKMLVVCIGILSEGALIVRVDYLRFA